MLRVIRKADIILFCVLIIAAGLTAGLFALRAFAGGGTVEITVDGRTYGSYSLREDREITVENIYGRNVVRIEDGKVYMDFSDCHNQICVQHAPISLSGESIICLPHKLAVEIKGGKEADVDVIAK